VANATELLRQGRRGEIWQKYCGFMDLSLAEFMQIQERLLLEQLHLLGTSEIGRHILRGRVPTTVEEFRQNVPLTTYKDYAQWLTDKREDALPRKPEWWLHTSGRTSEYDIKWIPFTPQMVQRMSEQAMACVISAASSRKGEFTYEEGDTALFTLAPFPYVSGAMGIGLEAEFAWRFLPPRKQAEQMEFAERIEEGFRLALRDGIDAFWGVTSILLRIGEQFANGQSTMKPSAFLLHPQVLFRLLRAFVRSRLAGRNYLLPRDLWTVKGICAGGTDTGLFRKKIEEYWGRTVVEAYACTEGAILALQAWNTKGMTFFPDTNFLEFIPEEEAVRSRSDGSFTPRTCTLAEVQPQHRYEIVFTNFHGGVMTRYRVGDLIEIVSLRDDEVNIDTPQMAFYSRIDDIIDLASFARLTERTIWRALEEAGTPYVDWTARKEYEGDQVTLHIYLEPKNGQTEVNGYREQLHNALAALDTDYANLHSMLGMDPLRVTLLRPGTFQRYMLARQAEGTDLARLKPAHMNAPDGIVRRLLQASGEVN